MSATENKIATAVKQQRASLDECVKQIRRADAATDDASRKKAVDEATKSLAEVRLLARKIDELFGLRIEEVRSLQSTTHEQSERAIAAAQAALARFGSTSG